MDDRIWLVGMKVADAVADVKQALQNPLYVVFRLWSFMIEIKNATHAHELRYNQKCVFRNVSFRTTHVQNDVWVA